jgi:hypothetical protein
MGLLFDSLQTADTIPKAGIGPYTRTPEMLHGLPRLFVLKLPRWSNRQWRFCVIKLA